jgi:hypothetical protein
VPVRLRFCGGTELCLKELLLVDLLVHVCLGRAYSTIIDSGGKLVA